jgi:hypothetical protein
MSFELDDKQWRLTLSDGCHGPSRYRSRFPFSWRSSRAGQ